MTSVYNIISSYPHLFVSIIPLMACRLFQQCLCMRLRLVYISTWCLFECSVCMLMVYRLRGVIHCLQSEQNYRISTSYNTSLNSHRL